MLTERFHEALSYASRLHARQFRKASGVPYVAHLLSVASLVLEHGGGENEAIAALLHDAIEDQGGAAVGDEIRGRFGNEVAAIVVGCTDTDVVPKPPWRARKEAYLSHLETAPDSVLFVSLADKTHNLGSIVADFRQVGESVWDRFNGGKEGTLWYYRTILEIYERRSPRQALVATLRRSLLELETLLSNPDPGLANRQRGSDLEPRGGS